jgi:hypothetical protein
MQLEIQSDMELNVLQVAVDDLIEHLEDVLEGEEPEERYIIEERLVAARRLKQCLDGMDWPQSGD